MIKMVFCQLGIVIGKMANSGDSGELNDVVLTLTEPRIMQIKEAAAGQANIQIGELLGNPKRFEIGRDIMNYDVTDVKILKVYGESVTGLTLIKSPDTLIKG